MTIHKAITKTAAEETLAKQFAALGAHEDERLAAGLALHEKAGLSQPGHGTIRALRDHREAAFAAFAKSGLPTRRDEAWHYTDLRAAMADAAPLAGAPGIEKIDAAREILAKRGRSGDLRLVLVDGHFAQILSDAAPAGVLAGALSGSIAGHPDVMVALNEALEGQGLVVRLDHGAPKALRVEIVHISSSAAPTAIYSRVSIVLGAQASADVFETFVGASRATQRNTVTSLRLGEGARCSLVTVVADEPGLHVESQIAELAAKAELAAFALVAGGALVRRQIFASHSGPGASIQLGGLTLLDGARHADTTLVVDHAAPQGKSREFYKHIVADTGTGVYQGKVIVRPGAQKTDGGMKSQAILLSPGAVMNNKPELEIFADDVVCGHGATVGALDPEQLFYLQARGLPKAAAEAMLLEAFGAEAIERHGDEALGQALKEIMRGWLARRAAP